MEGDQNTPAQKNTSAVSRRNFLKSSGLGLAVFGSAVAAPMAHSGTTSTRVAGGRAKNIIYLVSDGMSAGTFALADQFKLWKEERQTHWGELYQKGIGRFGIMDTASLDNRVTDSAAASSAWGCGHRVNNGSLNIGPNGVSYKPVLAMARDAGKATGLVTTATVTHATPAGFAVNLESRSNERGVMEQYLERNYDLLLGGGTPFVEETADKPSLHPEIKAGGYEFVSDRDGLLGSSRKDPRLIGLFSEGHLPYEVDRLHSEDALHKSVPSLAEMAEVALRRLSSHSNGFMLQIEGARVDHAAHSNDVGGLLFDQLAFDDAVGVALKFAAQRDDTLVIVTTDHGNSSPGMSNGANLGARNFGRLDGIRGSVDTLRSRLNPDQTEAEIVQHVNDVYGIEINEPRAAFILRHLQGDVQPIYRGYRWITATIAQVMANYHDIGWVGNSHTAEYVYLNAVGPGSELVKPFMKNTDMFNVMVGALGMERWV